MDIKNRSNGSHNKKWNIFSWATTYSDSYQKYTHLHKDMPRFTREKMEKRAPAQHRRTILDMESLTPLRKEIPISLMTVPNDIIGRDPHVAIMKATTLPEDSMMEEIIRTRPRVYESPQICIDDIPDPEMRKLILDHTYTTEFRKAERELLSMAGIESCNIPTTVPENDEFLNTSKIQYFAVSMKPETLLRHEMTPEQNLKGRNWESQQLKNQTNNSKYFWQKTKVQRAILDSVDKKTIDKIHDLVQKDKLAMPHDKTSPGYTGWKPDLATGMDLHKTDLHPLHPLISTYQRVFNEKLGTYSPKLI